MEKPPELTHPFYPGDRTYYVSDERLRVFRQLTPEQKLRWVEELATFLRMAKIGRKKPQEISKQATGDMTLDPGVGTCGKEGQSVPVGVGQPAVKIDGLTVGGTA